MELRCLIHGQTSKRNGGAACAFDGIVDADPIVLGLRPGVDVVMRGFLVGTLVDARSGFSCAVSAALG